VNGRQVADHSGGYDGFTADVTDALRAGAGDQELVVSVYDPTDKFGQPRGKQVSKPEGIWYTPVTGIWQTVWMEPVPAASIDRLRMTPDVGRRRAPPDRRRTRHGRDAARGRRRDGERPGGGPRGRGGGPELRIPVANPRLWGAGGSVPLRPARVAAPGRAHGGQRRRATSGMRKVGLAKDAKGFRASR
jgi:hypothetical protein